MSLGRGTDAGTCTSNPTHPPHCSNTLTDGSLRDSTALAWLRISLAGTANANAVTRLLGCGLQAAGLERGQGNTRLHPSG